MQKFRAEKTPLNLWMCKAATSMRKKSATTFNQDKEAKRGPTAANYAQMQVKDVNATY